MSEADGSCLCNRDINLGFWKGSTCNRYDDNYYGTDCKTYCNDTIGDNSRNCFNGSCNDQGICECYNDPINGYWENESSTELCNRCKFNEGIPEYFPLNGICSNSEYVTKTDCENNGSTWTPREGICSNNAYTNQSICEGNDNVWIKSCTQQCIQTGSPNCVNGTCGVDGSCVCIDTRRII